MNTLLGNPRHRLCWPEIECVRLQPPPDMNCLRYAEKLVRDAGFETPEAAAAAIADLPEALLHVKEHAHPPGTPQRQTETPTAWRELRAAVILGRSSSVFYDHGKFLIWTEDRLSRSISLYQPRGFYDEP